MSKEELTQFIDAVVQAAQFSPRASSNCQEAWRNTIKDNGGLSALREAISKAGGRK